jgi:hypothetical protein
MAAYYTNAPEVQEIAKVAFPDYNGKKFSVAQFQGPMDLASNWDGGSKRYYAVVNLSTMRTAEVPESGTMHTGGTYRITTLPPNMAVVAHSIFLGKDSGITIYVNQENLSKLLPKPDEVSWAEKVVLSATRSLKSSYAGVKDYRFREALKDTGITKAEWDAAKESLIKKKMLNAAGAITNDGKNAIGWTDLRQLGREKKPEPDKLAEPDKTDDAPQVELAERKETYWKCPHCKQEIYEKHSWPANRDNINDGVEVHIDCGGKFKRPPMSPSEQLWMEEFFGKSGK